MESATYLERFPRLFDLYSVSKPDENNYFSRVEIQLRNDAPGVREVIGAIDDELLRLSEVVWAQLRDKARHLVRARDDLRGWSQMYDLLSETKGYFFLESEGYVHIEFIPEGKVKSPDLRAEKSSHIAYLEVKTLNQSQEDLHYIHSKDKMAQSVNYSLTSHLEERVGLRVDAAKEQLISYDPDRDSRRICYLVINLDSNTSSSIKQELESFCKSLEDEIVEVRFEITRSLF